MQETAAIPSGSPADVAQDWPAGVGLLAPGASRSINWAAVLKHLSDHGFNLDLAVEPRQFSGGLANLNFLVRVNGTWAVFRRPPDGPLPPGANDMQREHRVLEKLWRALPLAPRSLHFCEDATVAGAPFQLLEYRPGIAIRGNSLDPLPSTIQTSRKLSEVLVTTLAAVHAVDPVSVGLGNLGRPAGFFRRTVDGWLQRASIVTGGDLSPAMREIMNWLRSVADPAANTPTLLQCDFKLDNILLNPSTMEPTAIVDWDMGTRGDPMFDLATMLSYWTEVGDPDGVRGLEQMPTLSPGFYTREQAAVAYADLTGRSIASIKPFRVLAMLKLGVVFLQLHQRHLSGETSDPRYKEFGALANHLLDFTVDVAQDRVF